MIFDLKHKDRHQFLGLDASLEVCKEEGYTLVEYLKTKNYDRIIDADKEYIFYIFARVHEPQRKWHTITLSYNEAIQDIPEGFLDFIGEKEGYLPDMDLWGLCSWIDSLFNYRCVIEYSPSEANNVREVTIEPTIDSNTLSWDVVFMDNGEVIDSFDEASTAEEFIKDNALT